MKLALGLFDHPYSEVKAPDGIAPSGRLTVSFPHRQLRGSATSFRSIFQNFSSGGKPAQVTITY